MSAASPYPLINRLLAKKDSYTAESWAGQRSQQNCINRAEAILQQLTESQLLPQMEKDGLVVWLLHEAPLTPGEKETIRTFAFEIDYY